MKALWKGQVPLARAFWEYAIIYGTLANLVATMAALALVIVNVPTAVPVCVFLIPAPYIIVAATGVWRSAETYDGPLHWAILARITAVFWAVTMVLI